MTTAEIYEDELEDGYGYVGQSSDVDRRQEQHERGEGSSWTSAHKIVREIRRYPVVNKWSETIATLDMMLDRGIDKVRGACFTDSYLDRPTTTRKVIISLMRGALDLCQKCGEKGHYIAECTNRSNDDPPLASKRILCQNEHATIDRLVNDMNLLIDKIDNMIRWYEFDVTNHNGISYTNYCDIIDSLEKEATSFTKIDDEITKSGHRLEELGDDNWDDYCCNPIIDKVRDCKGRIEEFDYWLNSMVYEE
jgi:hypothetical protein